jgi:5-methylcytosine-specific restriction protein A
MTTRRPFIPCRQVNCGVLVPGGGWCDDHKPEQFAERKEERAKGRRPVEHRPNAHARGYGKRWQKARYAFLTKFPLCRHCQQQGKTTAATVVDHIEDHKGDQRLFWDWRNWQPLCASCHSKKTWADNPPHLADERADASTQSSTDPRAQG